MEKLTLYFFIFIVGFLLYSFIKSKKETKKQIEVEGKINKKNSEEKKENFVLAAVIATIMDGKKYKIRNIFLEEKQKNYSTWKTSGKNYTMQRRDRLK
jgi:hypothetical protein